MERAYAGAIASVDLTGASQNVIIYITGTGFDPTAPNNRAVFTHDGIIAESAAVTVSAIDAKAGLRRIGVPIPEGLPSGTARIKVVNNATGETAEGASIEVIGITLENSSVFQGTSAYIRISGTSNAAFQAGGTVTAFGDGIKVDSETVESGTIVIAHITVAPDAAIGPRSVGLMTGPQVAVLLRAFKVEENADAAAGYWPDIDKIEMGGSLDEVFAMMEREDEGSASNAQALDVPGRADAPKDMVAMNEAENGEIKEELAPSQSLSVATSPSNASTGQTINETAVAKIEPEAASAVNVGTSNGHENKTRKAGKEPDSADFTEEKDRAGGEVESASGIPLTTQKPSKTTDKPESVKPADVTLNTGKRNVNAAEAAASPITTPASESLKNRHGESKETEQVKKDVTGTIVTYQQAPIAIKDFTPQSHPAPLPTKTISTPPSGGDENNGFLRKIVVAFLGPFVLIGYLLSHIWK